MITFADYKTNFSFPNVDNNFVHLGHPLIIPGKNKMQLPILFWTNLNLNFPLIRQVNYHTPPDLNSSNLFSLLFLFITCLTLFSQKSL
jgi:hypothetical protein